MAATRLGRRAQDIFSRDVVSVTRSNTTQAGRLFSASSAVLSQTRVMRREREKAPTPNVVSKQEQRLKGMSSGRLAMFLPGTFILPLASRLPRNPAVLFPFLKDYYKTSFMDKASAYLAKFASMPSFFARPIFKLNNASVVLTAKALHRSMSEAFASGDRDSLRKICADRVADTFVSSIDARPKGRRYSWELVCYNKQWRYPRIVSQKVAKLDRGSDAPMIRQVVVRICSRQRRTELDDKGRVVPESEREVDLVENVCMSSIINPHSWKQDEWRISGTVKDTDPEAWAEETTLLKEVEEAEMSKYKN